VNLQQLRYYIVLAEELNFQRAAIRIPCAQSSLSSQVAKLEREIGEPLLTRYPRHCELTAAGSRMYLEALRLVHAADHAVDVARGDVGRVRQTLRVGVPEEGIQSLMEVLLTAYRASHPGVEIIVEACDCLAIMDLASERYSAFDTVLWGTDTTFEVLEGFPVYRDPVVVIVGRNSQFDGCVELDPTEALDEVVINGGEFLKVAAARLSFSDFRNGTAPRYTKHVYTESTDIHTAIANGAGILGTTAGSKMSTFSVRKLPLTTKLQMGVGALIRASEKRPHVRDFATMGTEIGRSLFGMIPHASSPD
jgi:DNA-binding transcriptional LysR family regulator